MGRIMLILLAIGSPAFAEDPGEEKLVTGAVQKLFDAMAAHNSDVPAR